MSRFSRTLSALWPCHIDQLLYVATTPATNTACAAEEPLEIRHFYVSHLAGNSSIDSRISAERECYAAFCDGQLAHESWLRRDVLLPGRFGFDRATPVIGDSHTVERYRGRGLYRRVLQQILQDVFHRTVGASVASQVYILVAPQNEPSIRGIERAGFRRLARLQGDRIGGLIWRKRRVDG